MAALRGSSTIHAGICGASPTSSRYFCFRWLMTGHTAWTRRRKQGWREAGQDGCCPGFEIDVYEFLNLFSADNRAFEKAARISVDAIQALYSSLVAGFNFTRPGGIAPSVLSGMDVEKADGLARLLGLSLEAIGWAGQQNKPISSQPSRTTPFTFVPGPGIRHRSLHERISLCGQPGKWSHRRAGIRSRLVYQR